MYKSHFVKKNVFVGEIWRDNRCHEKNYSDLIRNEGHLLLWYIANDVLSLLLKKQIAL